MNSIITITLPIFLLIGIGYALVRSGLFTPEQFRGVGRVVINVALPALIVRSLTSSTVGEVLNLRYIGAYCGASLLVLAVGLTIGLGVRRRPLTTVAIRSLGMCNSNSAFVGFPVIYQLLGPVAGVGLALNILIENVIMIPTALALAEVGQGAGAGVPRLIARTFANLAKTPILIAVVIGIGLVVSGVDLPTPVAKTIDMTANIAPAASLLVIGAALVGLELKGLAATVSIIAVGKLVLHPMAVWGGITLLQLESPELRSAALIFAASPMLSMFPMLGQRYGEEGPCAAALLVTTAASFFTLSAWLWLMSRGLVG